MGRLAWLCVVALGAVLLAGGCGLGAPGRDPVVVVRLLDRAQLDAVSGEAGYLGWTEWG